jgi:hypothetical protein
MVTTRRGGRWREEPSQLLRGGGGAAKPFLVVALSDAVRGDCLDPAVSTVANNRNLILVVTSVHVYGDNVVSFSLSFEFQLSN